MTTSSMTEIAKAFTGGVHGVTDTNMVHGADSHAMNGEAPAANLAGNFPCGVEDGLASCGDDKNSDTILGRISRQPDRSVRFGLGWRRGVHREPFSDGKLAGRKSSLFTLSW